VIRVSPLTISIESLPTARPFVALAWYTRSSASTSACRRRRGVVREGKLHIRVKGSDFALPFSPFC